MQAAVRRPLMKSPLLNPAQFLFLLSRDISELVRLTADSLLASAACMAERPNGLELSCVATFYRGHDDL
jgi:hypothetical protein